MLSGNLFTRIASRYEIAKRILSCLSTSERNSYFASSFVIFFGNLLDLIGVFLFGLMGTVLLKVNTPILDSFRRYFPWLENQNRNISDNINGVFYLVITILIFFILKSLINILGMRNLFSNLTLAASRLSVKSLLRVNELTFTKFRKIATSDRQFLATQSTQSAIYDVLGYSTLVVSEILLLLLLGIFYVFVTQIIGIAIVIYFIICLVITEKIISKKMHKAEMIRIESYLNTLEVINGQSGVFSYLKDKHVSSWFSGRVYPLRFDNYSAISRLQLLANLPKFMLEILMIAGVIIVSMLQMMIQPEKFAVNLGLFFITAVRFMPSIARLQSYINQLDRGSQGSEMFLKIFEEILDVDVSKILESDTNKGAIPISAKNLKVIIEGRELFNVEELFLPANGLVIIYGESGSGKSTLLSLLSGIDELNDESEGIIDSQQEKSVHIAQFTNLLPFTIEENILLDLDLSVENLERYQNLIKVLNLQEILENEKKQGTLRTGFTLSGGELQRIGIARGLMRKSMFYFFDEPSASLDAINRNAIWELLKKESSKSLIVVSTHDIDGLTFADQVYRIQNKSIISDSDG